jgi:hypothetical protein
MSNYKLKPRPQLTEESFRRFERFIALGLRQAETIVDPSEVDLAASSFCARFADAKLAYRRYNYKPKMFPVGTNIGDIHAYALADGRVLLRNKAYEASTSGALHASDYDACRKAAVDLASGRLSGPISILSGSKLDHDRLKALEKEFDVAVGEEENGIIKMF